MRLKKKIEKFSGNISRLKEEAERELNRWERIARPKQLPPEWDWFIWMLRCGRGWGKTATAGNWYHKQAMAKEGRWMALISKTPGDARDDCIEGPGGLLNNEPPEVEDQGGVVYKESKRRLIWPNGSYATIYSGANPDQIRGFSGDRFWADELAAWKSPGKSWNNLMFGMREGEKPRGVISTTPRPIEVLKDIEEKDGTAVVTGSSYENRDNLADTWFEHVIEPKEGTTIGKQEIYAEYLEKGGELWGWGDIEGARWENKEVPSMVFVIVAVDPATKDNEDSDETGIVVVGKDDNDRYWILDDCSIKASPSEWRSEAINAFHRHEADYIVAETNQGGDMVETLIYDQDNTVAYDDVNATRGKQVRAQPVYARYETGKVKHPNVYDELENQMVSFDGESVDESPDRMDALVWGVTYLMKEQEFFLV